MLDLSFEINGRKVNPNKIENALETAVLNKVTESIKKTVGSIRCSEHHQAPKIKVKGKNLNDLSFNVSGCCEGLIAEVKSKFR